MRLRLLPVALSGGGRRVRAAPIGLLILAVILTLGVLPVSAADATVADRPVAAPPTVTAAVTAAEQADSEVKVAVAVLDTTTGALYTAGAATTQFPTESVVKVLIAAYLLANGQMSGATEQLAYRMITQSDDAAADTLWGEVDGAGLISWAEARYHLTDLGSAPIKPGWWGNTKLTATGLVQFYAAVKADPVVGPWLFQTMAAMAGTAADGTDQDFGLAAQLVATPGQAAYKQGWGGDDDAFDSEQLNSTGLLAGRYAVAVFVQHIPYESMADLLPALDAVSAAVAPAGRVAVSPAAEPQAAIIAPRTTAPRTTAPAAAAPVTTAPASQAAAGASAATVRPASHEGNARVSALSRAHGLRRPIAPIAVAVVGGLALASVAAFALAFGLRRRRQHRQGALRGGAHTA